MTGSGWRFISLGQNQATSAMPTGIRPNGTDQDEKIDVANTIPTAQAEMNGQRLGSGTGSRRSGVAATTVVSSISFSSTRSPVTTGSSPSSSHSGVLLSTTGKCSKL